LVRVLPEEFSLNSNVCWHLAHRHKKVGDLDKVIIGVKNRRKKTRTHKKAARGYRERRDLIRSRYQRTPHRTQREIRRSYGKTITDARRAMEQSYGQPQISRR
jgi:ribosome-binding protein aMBF1 (putative translation factor)